MYAVDPGSEAQDGRRKEKLLPWVGVPRPLPRLPDRFVGSVLVAFIHSLIHL